MSHTFNFAWQQFLAVGSMMLLVLLPEGAPCVDQTGHHADVYADAVEPREDVIAADKHTDVRYADVL